MRRKDGSCEGVKVRDSESLHICAIFIGCTSIATLSRNVIGIEKSVADSVHLFLSKLVT